MDDRARVPFIAVETARLVNLAKGIVKIKLMLFSLFDNQDGLGI